MELLITDPDRIREVVEEPLRTAKRDLEPARYVIIGTLSVRRKDGTTQALALFHPWGHFKDGETYMIADFSKLQKLYRTAFEGVSTASFMK